MEEKVTADTRVAWHDRIAAARSISQLAAVSKAMDAALGENPGQDALDVARALGDAMAARARQLGGEAGVDRWLREAMG